MLRRTLVFVTLLVSGRAFADATALMDQADKAMSDAWCTSMAKNGCTDDAVFPAAVKAYDEAMKLEPTPQTAGRYCKRFTNLQKKEARWALSSGAMFRALARCDFALLHPDADEATRARGRAGNELRNVLGYIRTPEETEARRAAAAKALFGLGLTVRESGGRISVAPGELDDAKIREYIAEYWSPAAAEVQTGAGFLDDARGNEYEALRKKGVLGWTLLEPAKKLVMCESIVRTLSKLRQEAVDFCKLRAVIEANSRIVAYRGKPVETPVDAGPGLEHAERIFFPSAEGVYEPVVTVAAPVTVDDFAHIELQRRLADMLYRGSSDDPGKREAKALAARGAKIAETQQAKLRAADAKVAGKGGVVVFAARPFVGWEMPELVKKGPAGACEALHYKAWAPRGAASYEIEIAVDGTACFGTPLSSLESETPNTDGLVRSSEKDTHCPEPLQLAGEHKVAIQMFKVGTARTGDKVITRDWKIKDETMGVRGKRVGGAEVTCTTR